MSVESLLKRTPAYRVVCSDAARGALCHAYLLTFDDKANLRPALRLFAKAMLCLEGGCGECRVCRLVEKDIFADCIVVPREERSVTAEDADGVVADTVVRPLEGDRKLYVVVGGAQMGAQAQNKLLKTLEEPPAGVHLLLGVTGEHALLPTVRSRVKRLEIPAFSPEEIAAALAEECPDGERLALAAASAGGAPGRAKEYYDSDKLPRLAALALETMERMTSSRDVAEYAAKIAAENALGEFVSVLKLLLRDVLAAEQGGKLLMESRRERILGIAADYPAGAALDGIAKIGQIEYGAAFNANAVMQTDKLLFGLLEGRYRWKRS